MPESIGRPQNDDRPGRLAFQGAYGAFSHEACLALRPWDEPIPFDTFEEVIEAVLSGDCDGALIPIENSSIGPVEPAATLVKATGLTPSVDVWRPIRHVLMAVDGARLSDIRTVESHPIALAQCERTLGEMGLPAVVAFDTAGAAKAVAASGDRTRAALGPAAAAEVYGLSILRHDLQDSADNRTRFVLISTPKG
jgi:prephenate dehydratase